MEQKLPRYPYTPPPENSLNHFYRRSRHSETPLIANLHTSSDQAIESAFSRLTLSQDSRRLVQATPFLFLPSTLDGVASAESVPIPMPFGEELLWAQAHSNNGGANGPFGFSGPHQSINMGPGTIDFSGRGPYFNAVDNSLKLMQNLNHQRQDFGNGTCNNNLDSSSLHGKKPFSSEAKTHFQIEPCSLQSNFCSSRSSFHNNQLLYHLHQQLSLDNMRGRIVSLAKDQLGSGVLNLKLEEGLSQEEIEMVLSEVIEFLSDLMRNQFGSHFVQKLFVGCNENQRTRIILALTKYPLKLINICLNPYGARATQKLLEKLITPQQISLVISALSSGAIALACDPNGQHVIQYCVKHFPGEYNKHLLNEIAENCFTISTNKSGCCLLQSCVEHYHGEARERLLSEIIINALQLAENPYGNYVVQYLLGMRMQEVTQNLIRRFIGYFGSLSCNKYASNVVEKFLLESGENHSEAIIMELLSSPNASMLLVDPYANFVIQSALSKSKGHVRDVLLNLIQINAASMQSNLYGKKILAWFEKRKLRNA